MTCVRAKWPIGSCPKGRQQGQLVVFQPLLKLIVQHERFQFRRAQMLCGVGCFNRHGRTSHCTRRGRETGKRLGKWEASRSSTLTQLKEEPTLHPQTYLQPTLNPKANLKPLSTTFNLQNTKPTLSAPETTLNTASTCLNKPEFCPTRTQKSSRRPPWLGGRALPYLSDNPVPSNPPKVYPSEDIPGVVDHLSGSMSDPDA